MKTRTLSVAAILLAATLSLNSCVGSFSLFNKLAAWNKEATDIPFLNELIFLVISPAYGVCSLADVLVLNSIEFWTGDNPLASKVGTVKKVTGDDGLEYAVKTLKNGYEVTKPNGDIVVFHYDKKTKTWSQSAEGLDIKLFTFNGDGTVKAYLPSGSIDLTMDDAGLLKAQEAAGFSYALR